MNNDKKLEDFAERELRASLNKVILGSERDGWFAFGRYYISPVPTGYEVYQNDDLISTFGSKRSAISWCVADFNRRYVLAHQIQNLDSKKQIIDSDIHCRSEIARRSKSPAFREMIKTKLQSKLEQNSAVTAELEKCISSAKYIQLRGFSNETARTSYS